MMNREILVLYYSKLTGYCNHERGDYMKTYVLYYSKLTGYCNPVWIRPSKAIVLYYSKLTGYCNLKLIIIQNKRIVKYC